MTEVDWEYEVELVKRDIDLADTEFNRYAFEQHCLNKALEKNPAFSPEIMQSVLNKFRESAEKREQMDAKLKLVEEQCELAKAKKEKEEQEAILNQQEEKIEKQEEETKDDQDIVGDGKEEPQVDE